MTRSIYLPRRHINVRWLLDNIATELETMGLQPEDAVITMETDCRDGQQAIFIEPLRTPDERNL